MCLKNDKKCSSFIVNQQICVAKVLDKINIVITSD